MSKSCFVTRTFFRVFYFVFATTRRQYTKTRVLLQTRFWLCCVLLPFWDQNGFVTQANGKFTMTTKRRQNYDLWPGPFCNGQEFGLCCMLCLLFTFLASLAEVSSCLLQPTGPWLCPSVPDASLRVLLPFASVAGCFDAGAVRPHPPDRRRNRAPLR